MRIAREALPFALGSVVAAAILWVWSPWAAAPAVLFLAFSLYFFRDPERNAPPDLDAIVSPADGRVIVSGAKRVSIFLNVFDVHVCRSPIGGRIASVTHVPGRFVAAFKDEASEHNERAAIEVEAPGARLTFVLVAGLVARRIVCKVGPGQTVAAGDRIGLIRFGSRVDVDLPAGCLVETSVGARVVAGETVIARRSAPGSGDRRPT